jgi:hypothetical protein
MHTGKRATTIMSTLRGGHDKQKEKEEKKEREREREKELHQQKEDEGGAHSSPPHTPTLLSARRKEEGGTLHDLKALLVQLREIKSVRQLKYFIHARLLQAPTATHIPHPLNVRLLHILYSFRPSRRRSRASSSRSWTSSLGRCLPRASPCRPRPWPYWPPPSRSRRPRQSQ